MLHKLTFSKMFCDARALRRWYLSVFSEVHAFLLLEFVSKEVDNAFVKVIASQVGVSSCGQNFKDTITNLQSAGEQSEAVILQQDQGHLAIIEVQSPVHDSL